MAPNMKRLWSLSSTNHSIRIGEGIELASPSKSPGARLTVLILSGAILWSLGFNVLAYSERLNAILIPLWLIDLFFSRRKISPNSLVVTIGIAIGVLAFLLVTISDVIRSGAHLSWYEALYFVYFNAGLFVIYDALSTVVGAALFLLPLARQSMKTPQIWRLRALRTALTVGVFAPYVGVSMNVHPLKYTGGADPRTSYGLNFNKVNFKARDGASLAGWFVPSSTSSKTIILVHGSGSSKSNMLEKVPFLYKMGFNVFLFDQRGHGESSGHTVTCGIDEARDVEAAAHWVSQQVSGKKIGVLAFSMGGSSVLNAVGQDGLPQVDSFVLDSTFADNEALERHQMNFLPEAIVPPILN
ncbi:alpha/beta fold hydrolase, partial [bacterium]